MTFETLPTIYLLGEMTSFGNYIEISANRCIKTLEILLQRLVCGYFWWCRPRPCELPMADFPWP